MNDLQKSHVNFCNKISWNNILNLVFKIIMLHTNIIIGITSFRKDFIIMKNINGDNGTKELRIKVNFTESGLTKEQYLNSCKQYLFAKRSDSNFATMSTDEQEDYLTKSNLLGYRFLGDKGLVENLNDFQEFTLAEIYSVLSDYSIKIKLDFSNLLRDKDDILLVGGEMLLDQIPAISSGDKKVTIWVIDTLVKELLEIDFADNKNISIKAVDIYKEDGADKTKYKNIVCICPFGLKRRFERGKYYGNDSSTIAAELLIENNLADGGILTTIMPSKVNFSQMEAHFRQNYARNLIEVISLPIGTFSNTGIKTYLYKFSKELSDNLLISDSIDTIGEKYNISDVTNIDSTWDFEKPFKDVDEDVQYVLNKEHKKLSDISDILRGKPLSKYAKETNTDEDFIYLDMRSIKEDGMDFSEAKKYTMEKDLSSEYLQDGDLLIPNKGNTSKVVLYKNTGKNCIASANLLIIRPDNNFINSEYLLVYLRSTIGQKLIKGLQRGAAMPFINHEDLKGLAVIVPNLPKQDNFIKSYKSKMEKYKQQLEEVQQNITQLEQDVNDIICGKKQEL